VQRGLAPLCQGSGGVPQLGFPSPAPLSRERGIQGVRVFEIVPYYENAGKGIFILRGVPRQWDMNDSEAAPTRRGDRTMNGLGAPE
jgi:hypothetical protein